MFLNKSFQLLLLSSLQSDKKRVLFLCLLGWGAPLLLVLLYYTIPIYEVNSQKVAQRTTNSQLNHLIFFVAEEQF